MIPKSYRFSDKNFVFLSRRMKSFRVKDFLFLYGKDKYKSHFAVVISKKVEKTAVKRNRYRRLMYQKISKILILEAKKLNVICLYKGSKIPDNAEEMGNAVLTLKKYLEKKQIIQN